MRDFQRKGFQIRRFTNRGTMTQTSICITAEAKEKHNIAASDICGHTTIW